MILHLFTRLKWGIEASSEIECFPYTMDLKKNLGTQITVFIDSVWYFTKRCNKLHELQTYPSKLIVSLVVGKRTKEQTQEVVSDTQSRLCKGHLPTLFSDGYEGYESSILEVFGRRYAAPKTGSKGRPSLDIIRWPQGLAYGQVIKSTTGQCSDGIHLKVVRGKAQLLHTLSLLGYEKINTSSVERHNGTSRLHNQRKVRKTLAFSKSHLYHGWMSWLSVVQYNFCRAHGSLRIKDENGVHHRTPAMASVVQYNFCRAHGSLRIKDENGVHHRTPAMASGLTHHIWSTREWLLHPILGGQG